MARFPAAALTAALCLAGVLALQARQVGDSFIDPDHPAIEYATRPSTDPVARLGQRITDGTARLTFEGPQGYLRSLLAALEIPVESQLAVFSRTSFQGRIIHPRNPRAIYFNDTVAVAMPTGGLIELAAHDPRQGVNFYVLEQAPSEKPSFIRPERCVTCHNSFASLNVPGLLVRSMITEATGNTAPQLGNFITNHRSPFGERWAGWYVTGHSGSVPHLGNAAVADGRDPNADVTPKPTSLESLKGMFDTGAYLSPYSDIAALMVFNHQAHLTNLITRVGWEARIAAADRRPESAALLASLATELVDYLLFVEEAPLPSAVTGTSGFAERFSAAGPRDKQGRSLRQLDLKTRLLRYPCSYMIYSEAFDALPADAREAVYRRLWDVLSGKETGARYSRLTAADRQAVLEILSQTKSGLPSYFL
jgi:hypothetical protein